MYRIIFIFLLCNSIEQSFGQARGAVAATTEPSCRVNIKRQLSASQVLYLLPQQPIFVLSDKDGYINIQPGKVIELYCASGFTRRDDEVVSILVECIKGDKFKEHGETGDGIALKRYNCKSTSQPPVVRRSGRSCHDGEIIEVFFDAPTQEVPCREIMLYEVCFSQPKLTTHWVHHFLDPGSVVSQKTSGRPDFYELDFFRDLDMKSLYLQTKQIEIFGKMFNSDQVGIDFILGSNYLARGHLTAMTDYVFTVHQLATFYYINAVPQWQSFNEGNWLKLESDLKRVVADRGLIAELYTGTIGLLELEYNNIQKQMYLSTDGMTQDIPVPEYMYKVVIVHELQAGVVFVGVNNPWITEELKEQHKLCTDVSDRVSFSPARRAEIRKGYMYACELIDFITKNPHSGLPEIRNAYRLDLLI